MILRKADGFTVNVRISPDSDTSSTRSEAELQPLSEFGGTYDKSADFQKIINDAKDAMGISKGDAFSNDRLRIEVSGPISLLPPLSICLVCSTQGKTPIRCRKWSENTWRIQEALSWLS